MQQQVIKESLTVSRSRNFSALFNGSTKGVNGFSLALTWIFVIFRTLNPDETRKINIFNTKYLQYNKDKCTLTKSRPLPNSAWSELIGRNIAFYIVIRWVLIVGSLKFAELLELHHYYQLNSKCSRNRLAIDFFRYLDHQTQYRNCHRHRYHHDSFECQCCLKWDKCFLCFL